MEVLRVILVFVGLLLNIDYLSCLQYSFICPYHKNKDSYESTESSTAVSTAFIDVQTILKTSPRAVILEHEQLPKSGFSDSSISTLLQHYFASASNRIGGGGVKYSSESFANYRNNANFTCAVEPLSCETDHMNYYYRTYDGSCNNLKYSGYGMAKSRYTRLLQPKYGDRIYTPSLSVFGSPLPNPRLLSLTLYGEDSFPDNQRTLANLQWGQLVAHDMSKQTSQGAPEDCCGDVSNKLCYPIPLHPHGPITVGSKKSCLHFARSLSDRDASCQKLYSPYAEKLTLVTGYLDLSSLYGNSVQENQRVRQFQRGLLKSSRLNRNEWLPITSNVDGECGEDNYQCYSIPDNRNQFIPTIAVLHTILLREHNRIAITLAQLNPHYSDERLFQEARKINVAQYQKITYYDYLPLILGPSYANANGLVHLPQRGYVHDYNQKVNAAPYAAFSAAAFRYSHNQIPGWFSLVSPNHFINETMRLSDYFNRPENVDFLSDGDNFDSLIRGLVTQFQKRPDSNIDKEIKHYFNRRAYELFGADLKSIDIQRARDFGIPSYNDFRQYCGFPRAVDWSGFADKISAHKIELMKKLYATPDDVDLSIGGSLESHALEAIVGPTFQCIIGRQFLKTRTGDRFFFECEDVNSGLTREQLAEIRKASLSGLFCNNANNLQSLQMNSFIFPNLRNEIKSCNNIPQVDLRKWKDIRPRKLY